MTKEEKAAYDQERYEANKQSYSRKAKEYYKANQDKIKATTRTRHETNKKAVAEYNKLYRMTHKEESKVYIRQYRRDRIKRDPAYHQKRICRSRFHHWFKSRGLSKSGHVGDLIGCTWQELCIHLESKFQLGMTWENQGVYGWHVDHIKPLALFDPLDSEHLKQAWHFTNLQPLWAADNIVKGDTYGA